MADSGIGKHVFQFTQFHSGFGVHSALDEGASEVLPRLNRLGIQALRLAIFADGRIEVALILIGNPQVVMLVCLVWVKRDALLELLNGLIPFALA